MSVWRGVQRRLHDEIQVTSVFVTHDQEEALEVADRVVVMNEGSVEQEGSPDEVYHHPANAFVYHFLGKLNLFHARIESGKTYLGEATAQPGESATLLAYVRPHRIDIRLEPCADTDLAARVTHINSAGPLVKVALSTPEGDQIYAEISHDRYLELQLEKDEQVYLSPRDIKVFSESVQ